MQKLRLALISLTAVCGMACSSSSGGAVTTTADLTSLSLSAGTLSPAFVRTTRSYTAAVDSSVTSVNVTAGAADAASTLTVNGMAVAQGSPSQDITLADGANTITIVVTAPDMVVQTYTITVNRGTTTSLNVANQIGTWNGTWSNLTAMSSDTVIVDVTQSGTNLVLSVDFAGVVLGVSNPPANLFSAAIGTDLVSFTGNSVSFGPITATLNASGQLLITGSNVPTPGIASFALSGTWTATTISLAGTVSFDGGGSNALSATLQKQ